MHGFLSHVAQQGDVVLYEFGGLQRALVNLPDEMHEFLARAPKTASTPLAATTSRILGEGLLTNTSQRLWRPRRVVVQRELSFRNVRRFSETFVHNALACVQQWRPGEIIDLQDQMVELALDNLGDSVFTSDFRELRPIMRECLTLLLEVMSIADSGSSNPEAEDALDDAVTALDSYVRELIATRRLTPSQEDDVLSVLVAVLGTDDEVFTESWARDEAITLVLAGHDTTAFAATIALWFLAHHPETCAGIRQQVEQAESDAVPIEKLPDSVPLAKLVVEEALRLYPPAPLLQRVAGDDLVMGGYRIPAGTNVTFDAWVTHRDPRYFENPLVFDPYRFDDIRRKTIPRHAYFPFGSGPRVCVGNHFALLQATATVAVVAARARWELLDDREPSLAPLIVLRAKDPVLARVVESYGAE